MTYPPSTRLSQAPIIPASRVYTAESDVPTLQESSRDILACLTVHPSVRTVSSNAVDGLVGFDIETGGPSDPLGFGKNCPPEQI